VTALPRSAALAVVLVLLAGCGDLPGPSDQGSARARAAAIVEDVRRAVEEAKERAQEESAAVDRETPSQRQPIRTDTQTAFEYERYNQTLQLVFASLEEFWGEALPAAFGVPFTPPSRYVYYRPEDGPGPRCGTEQAPAKNAFYCPAGDFIAWDESGLLIPYYVESGDFAAAFVLAHEFGHAMQARIPQEEQLTVVSELQADCFAGSWSSYAEQQRDLEAGDLDEATYAVLSAADVPGTPFTDPRAHGTGFERIRAFSDGYEDGPRACSPARAEEWLVTTR